MCSIFSQKDLFLFIFNLFKPTCVQKMPILNIFVELISINKNLIYVDSEQDMIWPY